MQRLAVTAKIRMWATGIARPASLSPPRVIEFPRQRDELRCRLNNSQPGGFTLLEMIIAIAIVALLLAVTVPSTQRMYQSMQYRESLRDVLAMLSTARREALDSGRPQDVRIEPYERRVSLNGEQRQLPEGFSIAVTAASELSDGAVAVIRFYPEGGSTGGDLDISSPTGRGVRITVDWLMGSVSQAPHDQG